MANKLISKFIGSVSGKNKALKEVGELLGKKAIYKNGVLDTKHAWVRKAEREGKLAGRQAWQQASEGKGTLLKSGSKQLSKEEAEAALLAKQNASLKVLDKAIWNRLKLIMKHRAKITPLIATGLTGIYMASSEPALQYYQDLFRNNLGIKGHTQTNDDFLNSYNEDGSRLAQIAYRQYVREHGYPKNGQIIGFKDGFAINPSVYKEINKDGKYANFTPKNILKASLHGDNQFEFTDGGMSGRLVRTPEGTLVNLTDETAWDLTNKERAEYENKGGVGSAIRLFMDKYGSSGGSKTANKLDLWYLIPNDTISGDYRGRIRDIQPYTQKISEEQKLKFSK